MILTDTQILEEIEKGNIVIDPFNPKDLGTNSYDVHLGKFLAVYEEYELDAIIAPAGGPAWKTDLVNGDHFILGSSSPAAISGYPNVVVPMGQIDGLPVGLSIFGRPWSEPILLEIAYSYEQGTNKRFTPKYIDAEL